MVLVMAAVEQQRQLITRCQALGDAGEIDLIGRVRDLLHAGNDLLEIERPKDRSEGYEVRWGPLLQSDLTPTVQVNLNLLFEKHVRATAAGPAGSAVMGVSPLLRALVARGHKVMALAPPEEEEVVVQPLLKGANSALTDPIGKQRSSKPFRRKSWSLSRRMSHPGRP